MADQKNQLVAGFLVAGAILVGLSVYFSFFSKDTDAIGSRIARVETQTGKVYLLHAGFTQKELVETRANVMSLDSIETLDTGEALISFESAYRVRVYNNALVTIEKVQEEKNFHSILIVKRGDIKIENYGRDGELFIAKNGERIAAADYNSSLLAQAVVQNPVTGETLAAEGIQGLTADEISVTISNHRGSFFKCYTQLLQKDPSIKGTVSLSFTIETTGKQSVSDVTTTELAGKSLDADFKKCLLEVMKRIEFRPFQGAPISTIFPLKFE